MKYAFLRNLILANSTVAEIIKFSMMRVLRKVDTIFKKSMFYLMGEMTVSESLHSQPLPDT